MGKSAIKMVLANSELVYPSKGDQPPYVRSKMSIQQSPQLLRYKACMQDSLRGKNFGSRTEARRAFTSAAKACSGRIR